MTTFTAKQWECLAYLSDKMEATALMVGEHLVPITTSDYKNFSRTYLGTGRVVLGTLRRMGYVMRIADLKAWRLTKEGRALFQSKGGQS